jgi:RES domain-containing protein
MSRLPNKDGISANALGRVRPIRLTGTFYRAVSPHRADDILSVQGSIIYGGRYNPPNIFGALYISDSLETCQAEKVRKAGAASLIPTVTGKVQVTLEKVLDLTDTTVLGKLGLVKGDLLKEKSAGGWLVTQMLANNAYKYGIEALLVPSIVGQGKNLVVFDKYITSKTVKGAGVIKG